MLRHLADTPVIQWDIPIGSVDDMLHDVQQGLCRAASLPLAVRQHPRSPEKVRAGSQPRGRAGGPDCIIAVVDVDSIVGRAPAPPEGCAPGLEVGHPEAAFSGPAPQRAPDLPAL